MTHHNFRQRVAATATVAMLAVAFLGPATPALAQEASPVGDWSGVLETSQQGPLNWIFHITEGEDGALGATLDSPDQGATGIPTSGITFEDGKLTIEVATVAGEFVGTMSDDGASIEGTWSQGTNSLPLVLERMADDGGAR